MSDNGQTLRIETARAFLPLLRPARYKGARGGRGSGKSHFVAERLIEDCLSEHHRVACLREYQSSIRDSSKRLISDKISAFGLDDQFRITDEEIRGPYDSLFVFKGLQDKTANALKSLEGFSRAWLEEAHTASLNSLETMTPTFRYTPGMSSEPEMYFTWNPTKPDDPIDVLFQEYAPSAFPELTKGGLIVGEDDPDFACVTVNYRDNPWFARDRGLVRDMERAKRRDPETYAHVWLGQYGRKSGATVFRNWQIVEFEAPPDAVFRFGADWGFSIDPTVLIRGYRTGDILWIDYEAWQVGCSIERTPELFDQIPGSRKWPIRADSARPETIDYMKRHGFPRMTPAVKGQNSVDEGVEFLKGLDIRIHPRCEHLIDEMSGYAYKVDKRTNEVLPILDDRCADHCIDSTRYMMEGDRLAPKEIIVTQAALQWARGLRGGYRPRRLGQM